MHTRRFATLLLGMWLAGSLFMFGVAVSNFQEVDHLLADPDPSASQMVKVLGGNSARMLLRYQVGELNRFKVLGELAQYRGQRDDIIGVVFDNRC